MAERWKRRAIYLTTIAAMVAMTGGFVLAATVSNLPSTPQGGAFSSSGSAPTGVSTTSMVMAQASASGGATANSLASPAGLTAGTSSATDTINLNAVAAAGDFTETITVTISAASGATASTEYAISVMVAGATSTPQLVYIETSGTLASPAVDTVNLVWDLGTGTGGITVTSVSDLVTQCSAVGTCA